jgi:hypothetical protein
MAGKSPLSRFGMAVMAVPAQRPAQSGDQHMAALDERGAPSRFANAAEPYPATRPASARDSTLDATDRMILRLERRGPGPHAEAVGISGEEYMSRLRRLLYDREANEIAPDALAGLRVELCSRTSWADD